MSAAVTVIAKAKVEATVVKNAVKLEHAVVVDVEISARKARRVTMQPDGAAAAELISVTEVNG